MAQLKHLSEIKPPVLPIPMVNVSRQMYILNKEIRNAVESVLESGQFILGSAVNDFERQVAEYLGVKHAVACASGTDALQMVLMALEVGPGDEIITTPFTFVATVEVIALLGATPVFVDIDLDSFNIDANLVEDMITERTKAILPVHLFGQPADMKKLCEIAQKYNLSLIEDCAQCFGSAYKGEKLGSYGSAGCFSFFPSKNLGGCGDGGLVTTQDLQLAETLRCIAGHGQSKTYSYTMIGINSRLDALQAAILSVKLPLVDTWNKQRCRIAEKYTNLLTDMDIITPKAKNELHVFHQYCIRVRERDKLREFLKKKGIASAVYYPKPLHLHKAYSFLGYQEDDFPNAENASKTIMAIPMFPELTEEEIVYITGAIKEFYNMS